MFTGDSVMVDGVVVGLLLTVSSSVVDVTSGSVEVVEEGELDGSEVPTVVVLS